MMALAVLRKGRPKIMGALTSPPVSKTTKSMGIYDCPTQIIASSELLWGNRVADLQATNA